MAIRLFFEYENQVVQLPVNPPELEVQYGSNNKTDEIVKLGEINILRKASLKEIDIESFFPATQNAPYVLTKGKFKAPQFYINFFEKIKREAKPCRFIVTDTKINMLVSIEDFSYKREAGTNDIEYTLSIKQYREYTAKVMRVKKETNSATKKTVKTGVEREKTGFAVGDTVLVNGKYTADSYGNGNYGTFKNFTGKISKVVQDKRRPRRYHITTLSGGWCGWVTASQMKHSR